ncbi:DNA repair-scaffolding protein Scaffolding protein involved in DNA repair [Channa argus]|uniref:DNA repair-scaffolding protein Scaffolding protein involved in DNA repair n=1 Tax=Channa argus TaxID=215402 RepID=A0A6G1Q9V6_CHAAH|nr:DNA repair-scaffolding protein Scaffolding protein involved in DNA repair [Channa argus]
MSSRKRKRYSKDMKCVFFPDDVKNGFQKVCTEPASLSSVSSAKSWEKWGDSFLDTPSIKSLKSSEKKLSSIRKLTPSLVQTSGIQCSEDQVHILWSSSDSEQSNDENQEQHLSRTIAPQQQCAWGKGRPKAHIQSYTRALRMLSADKDDIPVIDTDSDLVKSDEDVEKDSGQQISDCESEFYDGNSKDLSLKPTNGTELEISGYVSDGENIGDTLSLSRRDSKSLPLQTGEGSRRSVSDWVRSAQAMLQTPQKSLDRKSKTPEDSAKKKRKFQSGGLADRLNRLQCRQRSAISFWRHQSISDSLTTTVDRPGVLVLEVLEVQVECSMQLVHCEHSQLPREGHTVSQEKAGVQVLFNRETAAQMIPAPGDIIHIYPPWQSLSIDGFSCEIILNTHFSQKIFSPSKPANQSTSRGLITTRRGMPYYLGGKFNLLEVCRTTDENSIKQMSHPGFLCSYDSSGVLTRHCVSLLEAIEGLGQAGCVEQDVEVVVQRVYSIPVPDSAPVSILKPRVSSLFSSAPLLQAEKGKVRMCVLVQDSYGMFSLVQLHLLPSKDDLHQYSRMWEGKTCVLRGIKVVQRVTRERRTRLFSLIDSLWPPVIPLRDHGSTYLMSSESNPAGPAPSFCYLLSGQENTVEITEGQNLSLLYLPPNTRSLQNILQSEMTTCCCSFVATVLYKRNQSCDVGQGEVWLVLTDPSLQEEQHDRPCRRTVALCVSTSCVLTSSVLKALNSPTACCLLFRDAIKEHGVFLCVEHSVVQVCSAHPDDSLESTARPESLPQSLTEPQAKTLSQPVRLDPLSLETTPNCLCTLTGVIVGVDESTAYSWPVCNHCGSDNLEMIAESHNFHCVSCESAVDNPDTKIQLEVFLTCSSLTNCTLKVKLQQKTIMSILNTAALEGNEFPGYDVENVLGKEVGPLAVYVRVVTRKPALWIGLEEICL